MAAVANLFKLFFEFLAVGTIVGEAFVAPYCLEIFLKKLQGREAWFCDEYWLKAFRLHGG